MKGFITLCLFVFVAFTADAQRVITDTLKSTGTINFAAMQGATQVQVVCTELGGTSDGNIVLQGSVDNVTYITTFIKAGNFAFYPESAGDSLLIVDGATWLIDISDDPFNYYRIRGVGTSVDTTEVVITWSK